MRLHAMIARDSSRITMVDPQSKRTSTYQLPEGARPGIIDPVDVGNDLYAIGMKGTRIMQLVVFDRKEWHWAVLDLDEPVTRVVPQACLQDSHEAINPNIMVGFNWNGPKITKVASFNPWIVSPTESRNAGFVAAVAVHAPTPSVTPLPNRGANP